MAFSPAVVNKFFKENEGKLSGKNEDKVLKDFVNSHFYDVSKEEVRKGLDAFYEKMDDEFCYLDGKFFSELPHFIKTGEYQASFGASPLVLYSDGWVFVENNVLFVSRNDTLNLIVNSVKYFVTEYPAAVILPTKITKKNTCFDLLINADGLEYNAAPLTYLNEHHYFNFPTISFECLRRLYKKKDNVAKMLAEGDIEVVHYTPDSLIELTTSDKKKIKRWWEKDAREQGPFPVKSPGLGYFLLINEHIWHRPSTVLLHDKVLNKSYLLGMDEGSYFGVELADHPATVAEAFKSLTPKAARGKEFQRQGEWFAVPMEEKKLPSFPNIIFEFQKDGLEGLDSLARDSSDSAKHFIKCKKGLIDKNGVVYALDPKLTHEYDEHEDLDLTGWYAFHKNTAVKSVSVEGVD